MPGTEYAETAQQTPLVPHVHIKPLPEYLSECSGKLNYGLSRFPENPEFWKAFCWTGNSKWSVQPAGIEEYRENWQVSSSPQAKSGWSVFTGLSNDNNKKTPSAREDGFSSNWRLGPMSDSFD